MPSGVSSDPIHPLRGEEARQRYACHRGGECERQVHQRIHQAASREAIAHEHPGDEQPENGIDDGSRQRRPER